MSTMKNRNSPSSNTTRKRKPNQLVFEKLPKTARSHIVGMETYKINCGKNLLIGYKSIKAAEETSMHPDDFVHVIKSKLQDYNEPVVVKIYDSENGRLYTEINILKKVKDYRNTARLICHFSCKDDKTSYFRKIIKTMKPITFCSKGTHLLHFFVYEYIANGDISDFFTKNNDINLIKSMTLQITAVIIELALVYKVIHGDINSGNIMVDTTEEKTLDYTIDGKTVEIETYGWMPKMIDYGKSRFYTDRIISPDDVWDDITSVLNIIAKYVQSEKTKKNIIDLFIHTKHFSSLTECYLYVRDKVFS
jgi:serine/threonine protein kinase